MSRRPSCPACGEPTPAAHFLVCRPCWREVPFQLRVNLWTHEGRLRAAEQGSTGYSLPAEQAAVEQGRKAILSHLKQFSSAIA